MSGQSTNAPISPRARERLPEIRPANTAFDGLFQVPTVAEIIALVRGKEAETGRTIGLYPEIKHSSYFASIGFDLPEMLVTQLHRAGYRTADDPVFIQSFEVTPLVRLNSRTELRLVQLVAAEGGPADIPRRSYAKMMGQVGLSNIASYANGVDHLLSSPKMVNPKAPRMTTFGSRMDFAQRERLSS